MIFVFSLDDELSYSMIPGYYAKMAQYRNIADIPVILVAMRGNTIQLFLNRLSCCNNDLVNNNVIWIYQVFSFLALRFDLTHYDTKLHIL